MHTLVYPRLRRLARVALLLAAGSVGLGTTIVPMDFDQLVDFSERVVRGTVVGTRCEWQSSGDSRFIVTIVTLRVDEVVIGPVEGTLELELLGGQLDGERLDVAGQPQFHVGDEDILFVRGNGESICPLVGMSYGRILVVPDTTGRLTVARSNGAPIHALTQLREPIDDIHALRAMSSAQSSEAMSADDFCSAIRNRALRQGRSDVAAQ